MPIDPVMVVGDAQISSAAEAIQYPPEAATDPIETTTVRPSSERASSSSRRTASDAKALPPGLSMRRTIARTARPCAPCGSGRERIAPDPAGRLRPVQDQALGDDDAHFR